MRTRAGDFKISSDVTDIDITTIRVVHNDPSGNVEVEYDFGYKVNIASGGSSQIYWSSDWTDGIFFRFSTFDAYATELVVNGRLAEVVGQLPPQITKFHRDFGSFIHSGVTMKGKSLPTGLVDLRLENVQSPGDVDRIIEALEINNQSNGTLFIAEQRLGKTTALLESRGWDVEIEPDIVHSVQKSRFPHTSVIDGKAVHHVDRRRGGDRRKEFEGRCIELNGSSEYATCAAAPSLDTSFTVSGWYKSSSFSSGPVLFSAWDFGTNNRSFVVSGVSGGNLNAAVSADGTTSNMYVILTSSGGFADGLWHHVAMTFDNGTLKFFVDGVDQGGLTTENGTVASIHAPTGFRVGAALGTPSQHFPGQIYRPRIWDTALTAAQIAAEAAEAPQKPLAVLPVPLIELPMDDATTSPIIRNTGSLGQAGDFTLTGTPANIWTTCDRLSLPNEHGCSVGLVTNGVDSYLDTGITLNGATAFTVMRRARYLSTNAYDLDGFYNVSNALRFGRNTGGTNYYAQVYAATRNGVGVAPANGEVFVDSITSVSGGNTILSKNGVAFDTTSAGAFTFTNSRTYRIGVAVGATLEHYGHTEYLEYLIADRVLTDGEQEYFLTRGASGTPIDYEGDANILAYYDFQTPDPHSVANLADPGNPAKIVGDCEWVAINRDAADKTKDINGKALTWKGPVPRDAVISSPCVTLNGSSEFIQSINPVDLGGSELTASVRFRTTDADGGYLFALWDYNNAHRVFQLSLDVNGKVGALVSHDGTVSNYKQLLTVGAFDDGEWHIAEMTFDSGTLKLWVDKVEQTDAALTSVGTTTQVFSVSKEVTAGAVWNGVQNWISGNIADCKLSTTAATDDEVVAGTWDADVIDWPLCEGAGDTVYDVSDSGNHGKITGTLSAVWANQQNKTDTLITSGYAVGTWFDGSSDYLSRAKLLQGSASWSIGCFLSVDTLAASSSIASQYNTANQREFQLFVSTDGSVRCNISGNGATVVNIISSASVIEVGKLYHVVLAVDGVSGAAKVFVNGVDVTQSVGTLPATLFNGIATLSIGSATTTASSLFSGTLSQLLIHDGAYWSAADVAAIRAAGTTAEIAAIVGNLGGTAWFFPDAKTETLQGLPALTVNGAPEQRIIPAGAGPAISYGPGVPAPGQSRLIAPEPNSPFALRYAKDYTLDVGELTYEAVFGNGISHVDLGSILIGATDDFDISLDFMRTSAGGDATQCIFSQYTAAVAGRFLLQANSDGSITFFVDHTTDILIVSSTGLIETNNWHTVRVIRSGDDFEMLIDGVSAGTQTQAGVSVEQKNMFLCNDNTSIDEFNGRMRNLRVDNNGTVTERLTQNVGLPGATLTNVTLSTVNHGVVGGRQLFFNSDGTANLYETPLSADMTDIIQKLSKKYA